MRTLRIGHFLSHFPQPDGTSTAVTGLSRALAALGHQVTIYGCGAHVSGLEQELRPVEIVRYDCSSRNPFAIPLPLRTRLSANQDHLDLLTIHGMFNPQNVAVAHAAQRAGLPYVVCPHDPYHPALLRKRRRKLLYGWGWERQVLNGAVGVHLLCQEHARYLDAYGVRTPSFVVPNGFEPAEADRWAWAGGSGPDFLYLGRLEPYQKGLDLLLEAVALGLGQGTLPPGVRLHLVGRDRGEQHVLEGLAARLRLGENVRFYGAVRQRWMAIIACGVLVLPSRYDGFGLTVLEAMAAAKPVVVSALAGVAPWVREAGCGFLVEPTPVSICAGLVQALACRAEWRRLGKMGKDFAYRHLTWGQAAQRASEWYLACVT